MYIDAEAIITAGKVLGAILAIGGALFAVFRWYLDQKHLKTEIAELKAQHNDDIHHIKKECTVICYGLDACLDGLEQLGCNHSVPEARTALQKHLNIQAHE